MAKVKALIVAAGRGTRAGLPYPKTLFSIKGIPILVRIFELLNPYDSQPTVIVSPDGLCLIGDCLSQYAMPSHLVVQNEPKGMGDAVLRFIDSPAFLDSDHTILIWGDIPFIQKKTLDTLVGRHFLEDNDFTFATKHVDLAYTVIFRDASGGVAQVIESREEGSGLQQAGEREIGLFIFRTSLVVQMLKQDLLGKFSKNTGEHGFLYVIGHLVKAGHRVVALPIATDLDLLSLNSMKDIDGFL
jgi:bifunctional UDP-N-acetylglucosamine pyrophosphorylase/glucosamine-1-phosphate N-acetyltransferase